MRCGNVPALVDVAAEKGALNLMPLLPLALMHALRKLGFDAERIGESYLNEGDGRRYAVDACKTHDAAYSSGDTPSITTAA